MSVVPFKHNNDMQDAVSLNDWLATYPSEEDLRTVFINMDRALKYIHNHDYCVSVFYPTEITILGNSLDCIQFNKLVQLSKDSLRKREMIKEDILRSSLIQIGIYSNSLKYINPEFVKENFDSFSQLIPVDDIPYYRGVIQRGASVYFCEYVLEKRNRDLSTLEAELEGEAVGNGKSLQKSSNRNIGVESITNDFINDRIYAQINGMRDAAFVNYLVIPTLILVMLLAFGILTFVFGLI